MNLVKSRWKGLLLSLAVVAAVAGITLGVTTLLGVTFQGSGAAEQGDGARFVEGLLVTANRDRLAICVQAVGLDRSVEAQAKTAVEAALVEVRKHPRWEPLGLGTLPPIVDIGCPSGPAPPHDPASPRPIEEVLGHTVEQASEYLLFAFVLSPDELRPLLGDSVRRYANQEVVIASRSSFDAVFATVSAALYVTPQELESPAFLRDAIENAIGLKPDFRAPPP